MVCLPVWDRRCCCWMGQISSISILSAPIMEEFPLFFSQDNIFWQRSKRRICDVRASFSAERSGLFWRTVVAQSPTNVSMFLSDFRFISLALFSGTRQIQLKVTPVFAHDCCTVHDPNLDLEEEIEGFNAKENVESAAEKWLCPLPGRSLHF